MRGAGIESTGGEVRLLELPEPRRLRTDEVLISVRAAGVGNWDDFVRAGSWDVGAAPPMALGVEAAGVVEAVGEAVTRFRAGDELLTHPLPLREQGAWAERLIAPTDLVARKPAGISWEAAGAFPVPALTAEQVLAELAVGERVLVHGAGGVTGSVVVQLALAKGASVVATAGPASADRVRGYGAEVLDYRDPEWPAGVQVDLAVNAVRGDAALVLSAVADGGRLATITGDPPPEERGITVSNVYVRPDGAQLAELAQLLGQGRLSIPVAASYPLEDAASALAAATAGRPGGAVVLFPA